MAASVIKSSKAHMKATISVIALVAVLISLLVASPLLTSAAPNPSPSPSPEEEEEMEFHVTIDGSTILGGVSVVIDVGGFLNDPFSGQIDEGTVSIGEEAIVGDIYEGWARMEMGRFEGAELPTLIMECRGDTAEGEVWVRLIADVDGEALANVYGFVGAWGQDFPGDDEALFEHRENQDVGVLAATFVGEGTVEGFEAPKSQSGTLVLEAEGQYNYKGKTYQVTVHVEADWELNPMERDYRKQFTVDLTNAEVTIEASDGIGDGTYSIWGKAFESTNGLKFSFNLWDQGGDLSLSGTLYDESGAKRGSISGFKLGLPWDQAGRYMLEEGGSVDFYVRPSIKLDKNADAGISKALSIKPDLQGTLEIVNTTPEED